MNPDIILMGLPILALVLRFVLSRVDSASTQVDEEEEELPPLCEVFGGVY